MTVDSHNNYGVHSVQISLFSGRNEAHEDIIKTSCARGDTICLRSMQVDNIFAFIHQVASVPACWLFKTSATS